MGAPFIQWTAANRSYGMNGFRRNRAVLGRRGGSLPDVSTKFNRGNLAGKCGQFTRMSFQVLIDDHGAQFEP